MSFSEAESCSFNPFDLTKVWSQKAYPLRQVGKLVLDRNPKNYFAEVEQSAFSPAHLVPGIEPSPDKMLQVNDHLAVCPLRIDVLCKNKSQTHSNTSFKWLFNTVS